MYDDVLAKLREQFVSEFSTQLNGLEASMESARADVALQARAIKDAGDFFHRLAGVAETFGLATLGRMALIVDGVTPLASDLGSAQRSRLFDLIFVAINATRDSLRDVDRVALNEAPLAFPEPKASVIREPIFDGGRSSLIAIVDDDSTSGRVIESCLRAAGYQTLLVQDPFSALATLGERLPDLILLDVAMPGLDGFQLCEQLRRNAALELVPIVFVTAKNDTAQKVRGLKVGGNDYIEKPFNPDELVARVSAHLERLRTIRELAIRDSLTGVYNHKYFETLLANELRRAERYGQPLSLALLDVDHFKTINDTHGHLAGDAILGRFVRVITGQLRTTDVVGRWGGDEFVVLLTQTPLEGAEGVMGRIVRAVAQLGVTSQTTEEAIAVSTSIGLTAHRSGDNERMIMERADLALYQAKQAGRARVAVG